MDDETIHQSTIVSVDSATQITIADATDDTAAVGNYVKAYHPDFSVPVSLQHTGADRFYGGEWAGFRKAAFYIDGQQTQGNGGHIFDGVIIEGNPGFGLFVKDYNNAFNPMMLRNVWFEDNAVGSISYNSYTDPDGIATSQTPAGAGNFTLDGALTSGGTYTADTTNARQLSFTSASNESGDTYTITGTDADGNADTENVTGPNATTVYSTKAWRTVTQIATNGAATGAITIGVTAKVDLGDGQGPREPRDMYFENVDHVIVEASQLRSIEVIDSYVEFNRCKVDPTNTKFYINDSVGGSHVALTNIQVVQWGDDSVGAGDVVIESITGPLRTVGSTMRQWVAPQRNRNLIAPPGSGVYKGGDTFENGEDLQDTIAADDKVATIVDGFSFPSASQYVLTAAGDWQVGATPAAASMTASKYIVATQEIRLDAGELSKINYIGSVTWTRNTGYALVNDDIDEWKTLAWVGKATATDSGTCRFSVGTATGQTATITLGASQIVEFDTEGEAIDYYNQRYLCTPAASLPLHQSAVTKVKLADENVASSTTLQDDDHLVGWSLAVNKYYKITGQLREAHNVGDFKLMFDFTNTPQEFSLTAMASGISAVANHQGSDSTPIEFTTLPDSTQNSITLTGFVRANATTGGTVDFQWAQVTSSANNTSLSAGSWITIERIG